MINVKQAQILRHTLGIREGREKVDRNHFVTGEGSADYPICMSLVETGLMFRRDGNELSGGDYIFHATDAGKEIAQSCRVNEFSSRVCERGTLGCEIQHEPLPTKC